MIFISFILILMILEHLPEILGNVRSPNQLMLQGNNIFAIVDIIITI